MIAILWDGTWCFQKILTCNRWKSDQVFAGKWPTLAHEPGYIFVIGNVPLSGLAFLNWCLATTLVMIFWVWCDLWRLHCGNSFNNLQFIESDNAFDNKLVHSLLIWLIQKHPYTPALIHFKKVFHFLTSQISKLPKTVAKRTKNMTSFPCSVRPEKFHPWWPIDVLSPLI